MIERLEHKGKIFALIIRGGFEKDGVNFVTTEDNSLQLGILKHEKGVKIKPHVHKKVNKIINNIQEVLHVEYGKVEVNFYEERGKGIDSRILSSGDTILLIAGGHGFEILEDSKIIEIKQGPYYGNDEDKRRFKNES